MTEAQAKPIKKTENTATSEMPHACPVEKKHAKFMLVTPKTAEEWIKYNTWNRNLSKAKYMRIANDLRKNGPRPATHQGVAFRHSGELADGQTRLTAIVVSGVAIELLVTWGLSDDAVAEIDQHRPRNHADAIKMGLLSDWIEAKHIPIIKMMMTAHTKSAQAPSAHQVAEIGEFLEDPVMFAADAFDEQKKYITTSPVRTAIGIASASVDQARLLEFSDALLNGVVQSEDDIAAIKLRDFLTDQKGGRGGHQPSRMVCYATQRAIKAFMDRQPLKKLYVPDSLIYRIERIEDLL